MPRRRTRLQRPQPTSIHQRLLLAIEEKRLIAFFYQDLPRVAEPHDYGVLNGIEQLLVYQVAGESRSQKLPDWRLIRVVEMKELRLLSKRFPGGRLVPSGKHKKWDTLFARVVAAA